MRSTKHKGIVRHAGAEAHVSRAPHVSLLARAVTALVLGTALLPACGDGTSGGGEAGPEPLFPEDYATSYVEVRDCRQSGDHDLNLVRMLADAAALGPYQGRNEPFPEGAVVLKEEYEFDDIDCEGPIKQWTVMQRLAGGSGDETLGWAWQRVDSERNVATENDGRCVSCHTGCGVPPDGYEGTCSIP